MTRRVRFFAALCCGLLASAQRVEAQQTRFYLGAPGDTAIGLIPGTSMRLPIRAAYLCGSDSARLTIRYDPAILQIDSAMPAALDTGFSSASPASGLFTVRGEGYACGSDVELFTLHATLASATTGMFLWMSVDSLGLQYYAGNQALQQRTSIAQVCHATNVYGDVDGSGRIDSRDALIVLSNAVGLPVTGFDLAAGDVDRDGLANSRDALLMLTYSIGLSVPSTLQIGEGAADACPGLSAPGEAVVFKRNGAGIELLGASSTTPTMVPGTTPNDSAPRLANDGTTIIYQCADPNDSYYSEICRIARDGTGQAALSALYPTLFTNYEVPDVSPNGLRLAFASGYYNIVTMYDSVNALRTVFPGPQYYVAGVAWSRDGSKLAYTSSGFNGTINAVYQYWRGLFVADSSGASIAQIDTGYTYGATYGTTRWSPAGDSVAYTRADGRIWSVPAAGGVAATPLTNFQAPNNSDGITAFDWGPQGLIFSLDLNGDGSHPSLWLLPSSTSPIRRITAPASGDWQPSFRRNP